MISLQEAKDRARSLYPEGTADHAYNREWFVRHLREADCLIEPKSAKEELLAKLRYFQSQAPPTEAAWGIAIDLAEAIEEKPLTEPGALKGLIDWLKKRQSGESMKVRALLSSAVGLAERIEEAETCKNCGGLKRIPKYQAASTAGESIPCPDCTVAESDCSKALEEMAAVSIGALNDFESQNKGVGGIDYYRKWIERLQRGGK